MNEHIKNYCERFIESNENPNYAVFIKGKWGSGKTFFITKLLEKYTTDTKIKRNEIITISLFGVKTTDEIDLKIYEAIHPILSSKEMKLFGAVLKSALKLGTTIDLNNDNKDDLSLSSDGLSELKSSGKVSTINKRCLIIDDFERAIISPTEIFGYFSEIISDSDVRIIFVGNEEKTTEKFQEYLKIKEKTIGIEFEIVPETQAAIDSFILELELIKFKWLKDIILSVTNILECNNLRVVRQSLYNLKLIIDSIDELLNNKEKKEFTEIFLLLYIEKSLEYINQDDELSSILIAFYQYHCNHKEYLKQLEERKKGKDFFHDFYGYIPYSKLWIKLIFKGYYDIEWVTTIIKDEKTEKKEKEESKLFQLLNNWRNLTKEEFQSLIKEVVLKFDKGEYLYCNEILSFTYYMLFLSKKGLIPDTYTNIKSKVDTFFSTYTKMIIATQHWDELISQYESVPEFNSIRERLKEINTKNLKEQSAKSICDDIALLGNDTNQFIKNIILVNGTGKFDGQPILSYMNINSFYQKLITLSIDEQRQIVRALSERYGKEYVNEPFKSGYIPDLENLKELMNLYKNDSLDITYDPQKYLTREISDYLEKLVEYFERKINENTTKETH